MSTHKPPQFFIRFFQWYCKPHLQETILGDLEEQFDEDVQNFGTAKARRRFAWTVIRFFRKDIIKSASGGQKLNYYGMFKNNFKTAVRNLIRQKGYTAINLFGLTVGMAISMLIIIFIIDQGKRDEYHTHADQVYRVVTEVKDETEDRIRTFGTSPYELQQIVNYNLDEVQDGSQLIKAAGNIRIEKDDFQFSGLYVSPNFLSFFQFDLITGDAKNSLVKPNSIIISNEFAQKMFGKNDALGQLVNIDDLGSFSITGIIDDKQHQSHIEFDLLLPIGSFITRPNNKELLSDWESQKFYNYFHLKEDASPEVLKQFLSTLSLNIDEERKHLYAYDIQALEDINLGRVVKNEIGLTTPSFVAYFFAVLGLVLILSASFNYMNLAIARGLKRAKEVGIRKTIGASKRQIIGQFLIEAQIVVFVSMIAAFLLLQILVPIFNDMKILRDIDGAITMDFNANLMVYFSFISFAIIVGLVSGAYPAFYLSSFKSLDVLKGGLSKKSPSFLFRKLLIFSQYTFSIIFIVTTIIIYQQARIFINTDYGFNYKNIINVEMRMSVPYEAFRNELLKKNNIKGVSAISSVPVASFLDFTNLSNLETGAADVKCSILSVDPFTIDNLELQVLAGRNFQPGLKSDIKNNILINEKAMTALGFDTHQEAIGQVIKIAANESTELPIGCKVIGVVKDFSFQMVFKESGPLIMNYDPANLKIINIKTQALTPHQAAAIVESVWDQFETSQPFDYETYDYAISDINDEFEELVYMLGFVSIIAIIIACLGQLSMIIHHVQLKVKEIGIRKVLGSSLTSLMIRLSKDFLIVISIAVIIGTPIAWLINYAWTSKVYRAPDVSILDLCLGVAIILVMAFFTIYFQVRNAVQVNPAETLRAD